MGVKGCKYLSRTSAKNLKRLGLGNNTTHLGNNNLEGAGVSYLTKAQWRLEDIELCTLIKT